jgi:hypothetical protein
MNNYYTHPQRLPPIKRGKNNGVAFHVSWFENVIKRIEHIKPVSVGMDNNTQQPNTTPLIEVFERPQGDGREIRFNAVTVALNVCSNGTPAEIVVLTLP